MKWITRLTLQWRVTLLTALVLVACSVALTIFSILNAQRTLDSLIKNPVETRIEEPNSEMLQKEDALSYGNIPLQQLRQSKMDFNIASIVFCIVLTVVGTGISYFVSGESFASCSGFEQTSI